MVKFFSEAESDTVKADKQRLRQSELLLTQLYRNESRSLVRMPHVPGAKLLLNISVLAIILFTGTLFYKFNSFIMLREDVYTKAGNLQSAIQRRTDLFGNLINLTLNHAVLEHSIFSGTAKLRSELMEKSRLPEVIANELAKNEPLKTGTGKKGEPLPSDWNKALESLLAGSGDLQSSLGRLLAVVEQYPTVQSAQTYHKMMTSLVDMEDLIATRRVEYQQSLREYNVEISKYPWSLLAEWTSFGRMQYFTASNSETSGAPIISPDLYKRLLPLESVEAEKQVEKVEKGAE
nr:Magnetosome protein MamQ, LemA family [uncultured bacterium]